MDLIVGINFVAVFWTFSINSMSPFYKVPIRNYKSPKLSMDGATRPKCSKLPSVTCKIFVSVFLTFFLVHSQKLHYFYFVLKFNTTILFITIKFTQNNWNFGNLTIFLIKFSLILQHMQRNGDLSTCGEWQWLYSIPWPRFPNRNWQRSGRRTLPLQFEGCSVDRQTDRQTDRHTTLTRSLACSELVAGRTRTFKTAEYIDALSVAGAASCTWLQTLIHVCVYTTQYNTIKLY